MAVWFAHLILTGVIGWFLFRHLRRSRLPWLPPRHWMILMGGALVLGGAFLYYAIRLLNPPDELYAMKVFNYSIVYLMALFAFLLADHWLLPPAADVAAALEFVPA